MKARDFNQNMGYHKYVLTMLIYSHMSLLLTPLILVWVWIALRMKFSIVFGILCGSRALFTGLASTDFSKIFFKTESHGTIYTFKNYFAIVFLIFSNKWYSNRPLVHFKYAQGINDNFLVHVIRLLTLNTYMSLHTYALLLFPDLTIHSNMYNCVWFTAMDFFFIIIYIWGTF